MKNCDGLFCCSRPRGTVVHAEVGHEISRGAVRASFQYMGRHTAVILQYVVVYRA